MTSPLAVVGNIARVESCYLDGDRHAFVGGAALHVALAAARAGVAVAPVSVIGADLEWIRNDAHLASVDLSSVKTVQEESCFLRLVYNDNEDRNLTKVECSYGAAMHLTDHVLDHIGRYRTYHICCRRPLRGASVLNVLAQRGLPFSVDFFVSSVSDMVASVSPVLANARVVFVNAAEHRMLDAALPLAELPAVLITDGPFPARLLRFGQEVARALPPTAADVDVTGSGDVLAGTFLAAQEAGRGDEEALRAAVVAASAHVSGPHLRIDLPNP